HGDVEWASEMNRLGGILGSIRHADQQQRDGDFAFLAGPIKKIRLRELQIEFERVLRVRRVARFYGSHIAVDAIQSSDRLSEFFPLRLRRAPKGYAKRELVVTAKKVTQLGRKFAEVAHFGVDFHALRLKERGIDR